MFEHLVSFKFKEKLGKQKEMELIESLFVKSLDGIIENVIVIDYPIK